jgi:hypothetical protein
MEDLELGRCPKRLWPLQKHHFFILIISKVRLIYERRIKNHIQSKWSSFLLFWMGVETFFKLERLKLKGKK